MNYLAISSMTCLAIGAFAWLIATSQHRNLYSLRNLFLAVWLYYGFSIGIDLMLGAELPYTTGEPHLSERHTWNAIARVMWHYVLCGLAFMVTYSVTLPRVAPKAMDVRIPLRMPPSWVMVLAHAAAAIFFIQVFFGMERVERLARAQESTSYKFACLIVPVFLALDVIVILADQGKRGQLAWVLAVLLSLVTGNRSYVLLCFLVAAFRWRPAIRGWRLVGMASSCGLVIFTFKTSYSVGQSWWLGERISLDMVLDHLQFSLAALDANASYLIAIFYMGEPSPLWLGRSYIETPLLLAWPRFLGGSEVQTLAEHYVWTYHPSVAAQGGAMAFSAMAEAWLNFGHVGSILVGIVFGGLTRVFDSMPRGISFYIVMLIVVRLFRSDAATLVKNWIIVWGVMFAIVYVGLCVYTALASPRTGSRLRPEWSPIRGSLR